MTLSSLIKRLEEAEGLIDLELDAEIDISFSAEKRSGNRSAALWIWCPLHGGQASTILEASQTSMFLFIRPQ